MGYRRIVLMLLILLLTALPVSAGMCNSILKFLCFGAGDNTWLKTGPCEPISWGEEGAIACPASRVGSETVVVVIISNRRPNQQRQILETQINRSFKMKGALYGNQQDNAGLGEMTMAMARKTRILSYWMPKTLNRRRQ